MNYGIIEALGQIIREKNIDKDLIWETLKTGLVAAAKTQVRSSAFLMEPFETKDNKQGFGKSLLNSIQSQVKAAEIANEGITVEYESGLGRSTLDVIQSNSILLNSEISLANFERNYFLAQFKLLQAMGLLNSKHLKLQ